MTRAQKQLSADLENWIWTNRVQAKRVAKILGCSETLVSMLRHGKRPVSADLEPKFRRLLKTSLR
jgi:predicted XRE-type DNA-binding protein